MKNLSKLVLLSFIFMLSATFSASAFDYNISFTASGAKTSIDYITVQNLTQGTTATVPAGSELEITAVKQVAASDETLHIYPNPIQNKATVSYYANNGGNTQINVFGVDGRNLVGMNKNLNIGINKFDLTLPKGAYTLQINENGKLHTTKILSQSNYTAGIEFKGTENDQENVVQKVKATTVPMQYNLGDFLLFKAYSGNYVSILTDILSGSKTINFNFVDCKDVDGNLYSIVTIGNQVWMAENLKTSKYRNSIAVTDKTNLTSWGTSTTEASSDYASPSNSTTYGKLYNWYAASSTNNLAPLGWHIPTDADWATLSDFLGGLNLAGDKLKENGNLHWASANTTSTNASGFTALPGGSRSTDNTTYDIGNIGYWWSATEGTTTTNAWYRSLSNQNGIVTRGYFAKSAGMSVRCLMGDLPVVSTSSISGISASGFVSGGGISFDGNYPVTSCGVCWSTNQNPTINNLKTSDWSGTGSFTSTVTGLAAQTTYYVRAYASNSYGTGYGTQQTISTALATITTSAVSAITSSTATAGGTVSLVTGASLVTARGICWSINQNPTISDSKTSDGSGTGTYLSAITGLNAETVYYVRSYATNGAGTAYGTQLSFSTKLPTVTTSAISSITASTATSGGNVTDIGGAAVTARGVCWSTSPSPTIANSKTSNGTGAGVFTSSITGLTVGTTYYVRAYATNSIGTNYGNEINFTTVLPTVSTNSITNITATTASCGGNVTDIGSAAVTARGVCWGTSSSPTIANSKTTDGTGIGTFTSAITGLTAETTYYVRAYATNIIGTVYGTESSFSTKLATVTTTPATNLTATSVTTGGNITAIGGAAVTERGVCWSTSSTPTISNSKTSDGSGIGSFTSQITGLAAETTYYVRAFATNSIGTAYGSQITISTALPVLTTTPISTITANSASGGGNITLATGGGAVTERGICWSTSQNPTITDSKTSDGSGVGAFTSSITGLNAETVYYVRAYAINGAGTAYGAQVSFSTKLPTVNTSAISSITNTTATCGGNVTDIGGAAVTARGVCWSTSSGPTINNNKTTDSSGSGVFTSSITGLTIGMTYYVRAYATNSVGTVYGNEISFSTNVPSITTTDISSITATTAIAGGIVTNGSAVTARGICWSSAANPTTTNNKTIDGVGLGIFTSTITGLTVGSTYYVRAYATNSIGTSYGSQISFSTILPTVTTSNISSITATSALCGGNVTAIGGAPVTSRGICWSTSSNPTIALTTKTSDGNGNGSFTSTITGLSIGNTYYVRAYATNSIGTNYGTEISFSTQLPTLTTNPISSITTTSAISGGNITNSGGSLVTSRGICWNTSTSPTIANNFVLDTGTGIGSFTSSLIGLTEGTKYYVRAFATNSIGTAYSNEIIFSTNGTVTDVDGNVYHFITIGTQIWMVENLKTTKYNDGTPIGILTNNKTWSTLSITPAYCWYNNDSTTNKNTYGALYNWYAVNTGKLAPAGWHIPTDAEWTILTTYLGGESVAGGKLKEIGTVHWSSPNDGATNETGFTALPGGYRSYSDGNFYSIRGSGYWWSSSRPSATNTWYRNIGNTSTVYRAAGYEQNGYAVRCVMNL